MARRSLESLELLYKLFLCRLHMSSVGKSFLLFAFARMPFGQWFVLSVFGRGESHGEAGRRPQGATPIHIIRPRLYYDYGGVCRAGG
jgi:hypothetical protein